MKILNAIHAQTIGGVDQVFRNYNEVLLGNGHEVAALISDNGFDNFGLKKVFKLKNFSPIFDCLHFLLVLWLYAPDVVFCHSNRLMKWAKVLRIFTSAKIIAVNHGITFKNSLNCDFVVSINQEISDMVVAAGFEKSKSFVLPNVIKIDQNYQQKNLKNPPRIGIYGRIEPRKGFDILIKAAEILAQKNYDFRLKIGGFEVRGEFCENTLKDLAKSANIFEKCEFVGVVLDKKDFFKDVDIFCVPSREEPFGLVILEGFLFSTLVISSDTVGGKFLIKNEESGLLFENEKPEQLAQKIEQILQNPQIYQTLTKSAFLRLEKEFSFDFLSKEIEKILEKITKLKC